MKWILLISFFNGGEPQRVEGLPTQEQCHTIGRAAVRHCEPGMYSWIRTCYNVANYICVPDPNSGVPR